MYVYNVTGFATMDLYPKQMNINADEVTNNLISIACILNTKLVILCPWWQL
jgi:hypothetical protein